MAQIHENILINGRQDYIKHLSQRIYVPAVSLASGILWCLHVTFTKLINGTILVNKPIHIKCTHWNKY